ncbi:MAG: TrbI/VirB10 family protein [Leptolyngbyaceae cyanobacterium bins.59]|nr:TrbI/VirB10 family protein [Leptolyngbyaceae cyanobacterium bins.59]
MTLSTTLTDEENLSSADRPETTNEQTFVWNEQRAAALLGFQEEEDIREAHQNEVETPRKPEQAVGSVMASQSVVDPRDRPSPTSLGNSPFARLGLVGTVSLACFGFIGLFISSMAGVGDRQTKSNSSAESAEAATLPKTPELTRLEKQKADLLTEAALSKQEAQLTALSDSKNQSGQAKAIEPSKAEKKPDSKPSTVQLSPSSPTTAPPAYQTVVPTPPSTWNRLPVPSAPPLMNPTTASTPPVDPRQQWTLASTIGSYSLMVPSPPAVQPQDASPTQPAASAPPSIPRMEKVMTVTPAGPTASAIDQSNSEEAAILTGPVARYLVAGSEANALLMNPIVAEERAAQNSTTQPPTMRFSVKLEQPLISNDGSPALPAGTDLIAEMVAISSSGLVQVRVLSAVANGIEYRLPPDAISLRRQDGKPLIAQKLQDKGQEIAGLDGALVLFGGLAKVGEVINRPQSTSITTGLGVTTTATQTPAPNLAAAALEGGFNFLSQQVNTRNQQAIQATIARPNLWFIDRGTAVKVFVNQTIQL